MNLNLLLVHSTVTGNSEGAECQCTSKSPAVDSEVLVQACDTVTVTAVIILLACHWQCSDSGSESGGPGPGPAAAAPPEPESLLLRLPYSGYYWF